VKLASWVVLCGLIVLSFASVLAQPAQTQTDPAATTPKLDTAEAAIRQADAEWMAAINAKFLEKTLAMYDTDAMTAGPVLSPHRGLAEIRAMWIKVFSEPNMSINWKYDHIVVTESGTMAAGAVRWRMEDLNQGGTGLVVWRKQPDGKWKVLIDSAWASQEAK
jgi:ketosteroid isomerase-like protein